MGNQKSIESKNFSDESLKDFYHSTQFVRESNDPCFGEISIFKRLQKYSTHPEEQLVFMKQKQEPNKAEYTELYRECDLRLSYSHPNLLDFLGYDFKCQQNLCGTTNKCGLYYQYFERDLEHEINKRASNQNHFEEKEVLYLLESLASVGSYLQQQHIYHGDLRPINIFITPTGKIKIGDHLLLNSYRNNYFKTLILGAQDTFLSPQLMFALNDMEREPQYDEFKSDVWSLGLTILEVCSLCPSIQCYDFQDNTISYTKIQELLTRASQYYSFDLIGKIKLMLEEDERIRPDMIQLSNMLLLPSQQNSIPNSSRYQSKYASPGKPQNQQQLLGEASRIQNLYQTNIIRNQQPQQIVQQNPNSNIYQQNGVVQNSVYVQQQLPIMEKSVIPYSQPNILQSVQLQQQPTNLQPYINSRIVVSSAQGQNLQQKQQTIKQSQIQPYQVNMNQNTQVDPNAQTIKTPLKNTRNIVLDNNENQQQQIVVQDKQLQGGYFQQEVDGQVNQFEKEYKQSVEYQDNKFGELQSRIQNALSETNKTLQINSQI